MADPLLPVPDATGREDETVAADPGAGGPVPEFTEDPDRADGDPDEPTLDAVLGERTVFRTPVPGERLSPQELAGES